MKIKEYIEKISKSDDREKMEELADMLVELVCMMKKEYPEIYEDYKMRLYEMAYGKVLTLEMAEEWVDEMKPRAKWTKEKTDSVREQYGLTDIDDICFFVIMNMLYSDMKNILGNGDDEESVKNYVNATSDWFNDEDVGNGIEKTYNYRKYVIK